MTKCSNGLFTVLFGLVPMASADIAGHFKWQAQYQRYSTDQVSAATLGSESWRGGAELRLNYRGRREAWDVDVAWQGLVIAAEQLDANPAAAAGPAVIEDRQRGMDLTDTLRSRSDHVALHRLDRLNVGYSGQRWVWRLGRQAISWGNGAIYNPADVFSPFDPAAIDREYKTGSDMLYGQYLLDSGVDLQWVAVARRDAASGRLAQGQSSFALKFRGIADFGGYDLLLAEHYDELLAAIGWNVDAGSALWSGDVIVSEASNWTTSAVSSLSWSTVWRQRNLSTLLEYFYNGHGLSGTVTSARITHARALVERLQRGELFSVGRQYVAASATLEANPLLRLGATTFLNLSDQSAQLQLQTHYDWRQNLQLLAAINIPIGAEGTEFGGIATQTGRYLGGEGDVFVQLGWYF